MCDLKKTSEQSMSSPIFQTQQETLQDDNLIILKKAGNIYYDQIKKNMALDSDEKNIDSVQQSLIGNMDKSEFQTPEGLVIKTADSSVNEKLVTAGSDVKELFYSLSSEITEEIFDLLGGIREEDSVLYRHFYAAVKSMMKRTERLDPDSKNEIRPGDADLLTCMMRLSETANAYYDTHRGYKFTQKGSVRREVCDKVRSITERFYDLLDKRMGGEGLMGNASKQTGKNDDRKISPEEKKESERKMKELASVYGKWKKHFALQEGMERTKIRDKALLFEPYAEYMEIYKATHDEKSRSKEINEIIKTADYYRLQNRVMAGFENEKKIFSDPLMKLAERHADKTENRKTSEKKLVKEKKSENLSPEQDKALGEIDRWFLRNYNNGGMVGSVIGVRNQNGEIVSALLNKSKRERLFIYYLIETRQRKNPQAFDVFASQSYIPDIEKFKDRMLATRFKAMSRIMGGYVYMGKLTDSMQALKSYKDVIKKCSDLDKEQEEVKGDSLEELKKKKEEYRSYMLVRTYKSTKAFRDEAARVQSLGKKKTKADDTALEEKRNAFINDIKELTQADEELGEIIKNSEDTYSLDYKGTNAMEATDNAVIYSSAASAATANAHLPVQWCISDTSIVKTAQYTGNVSASMLSSLGGVLSMCYGIYTLTQNSKNMTKADMAASVAGIVQSAVSLGTTVLTGVETGKQYAEMARELTDKAVTTSKAVQILGITAGGIKTGMDMYTAVSGAFDRKNTNNAKKLLKSKHDAYTKIKTKQYLDSLETKKSGQKEQTPEETEKLEQEMLKAKYEQNMLKLSNDINGNKKNYAGISAVGSSLTVVGLAVPGVGLILSGAGTVIGVVSGILKSMSLGSIREKMFDTYYNFNEFIRDASYEMEARGQKIYDMDEFKVRMRRVLAAAAGYADVISACDQISKKYADQICNALFGEKSKEMPEDEKKAYIQLIKSFGLPYDEENKIPDAELLARRMNGR